MPGASVNIGTGTSITFATSGFSAEVIETIDWAGVARGAVPTTHMLTTQASAGNWGGHTFMPTKFVNPGTIGLMIHFSPQTNPPLHAAPETVTVTFPLVAGDATAATWSCTGFITEMSPSIPLENVMTSRVTLQFSGLVTMVDAT